MRRPKVSSSHAGAFVVAKQYNLVGTKGSDIHFSTAVSHTISHCVINSQMVIVTLPLLIDIQTIPLTLLEVPVTFTNYINPLYC